MQVAILGQSQDVQFNLGIPDSRYICKWPFSDSPRMHSVNWESMDTLTVGIIICKRPSLDSPRMYNVTWESMDILTVGIIWQVAILGQSQDVQCFFGYSDSG